MKKVLKDILWVSILFCTMHHNNNASELWWIKKGVPSLTWLSALALAHSMNRSPFLTRTSVSTKVIEQFGGKVPYDTLPLIALALKHVLSEEPRIVFENVRAGYIKSMKYCIVPWPCRTPQHTLIAVDKNEGSCWGELLQGDSPRYYDLSFSIARKEQAIESYGPVLVRRGAVLNLWQEAKNLFLVRSLVVYNHYPAPLTIQAFCSRSFVRKHGEIYGAGTHHEVPIDGDYRYRLLIPFSYIERAQKNFLSFVRLKIMIGNEYDLTQKNNPSINHSLCSPAVVPLGQEELAIHVRNFGGEVHIDTIC